MQRLSYIFISKASRASVSSLLSILTPIYLTRLGYSALYVGVALTTILAGNAFFNIILTWYGDYLGRRRSLLSVFTILLDMEHHQLGPSPRQPPTIFKTVSLALDYSTLSTG